MNRQAGKRRDATTLELTGQVGEHRDTPLDALNDGVGEAADEGAVRGADVIHHTFSVGAAHLRANHLHQTPCMCEWRSEMVGRPNSVKGVKGLFKACLGARVQRCSPGCLTQG